MGGRAPAYNCKDKHSVEIFKKEGWLPENGMREETLERHAKGHRYEELSELLKVMVEDMLELELNGIRFKDTLAQITRKRGSQISSRIWNIFEEINQGRTAEVAPRGRLNDQLLPKFLEGTVFTENFTSFYEVIAYSSLLRAFFGSDERIEKIVTDAVHRTFVKSLYEKSVKE